VQQCNYFLVQLRGDPCETLNLFALLDPHQPQLPHSASTINNTNIDANLYPTAHIPFDLYNRPNIVYNICYAARLPLLRADTRRHLALTYINFEAREL